MVHSFQYFRRSTLCSSARLRVESKINTTNAKSTLFGDTCHLISKRYDAGHKTTKLKGVPYVSFLWADRVRRSCLPSPATSALSVNLRQQLRRSRATFASNFGAPGQPSPATSALPGNFRQQLRRSRSTSPATSAPLLNLASSFGGPGQPRQQLRRSRSTSPATSALLVNA